MKTVLTIFTLLTSFMASANSIGAVQTDKEIISEQLEKLGYVFELDKRKPYEYNLFEFYTLDEYKIREKKLVTLLDDVVRVKCTNCAVLNDENVVFLSIYINKVIDNLNLKSLKHLRRLEIKSRTRSGSISNLKLPNSLISLDMSAFIKIEDTRFFNDIPNLKYVAFDDGHIESLDVLKGHHEIEFLRFTGNKIKNIDAVKNMKKLKVLKIGPDGVERIPEGLLPDSIEELRPGANLKSLPAKLPENLMHLGMGSTNMTHTLDLRKSKKLKILSVGGSSKCKEIGLNIPDSLQELSATRCRMENIAFPKNTQLKKVDLEINPIKVIDPPNIYPTVEELSLSNTRISSLDGIEHFPNLKKLQLRDCKLLIDISAIKHLKQLEEVDLSESIALKDISPLYHLKNIRIINLEDAENADVPEDPTIWPNIKEFYPPDHYTHEELRKIDAWVYDRKKL
ncbi:leucine-rich repeat domain-containing protein [Zooshikella sp. RANM57]|uniref:leucine-rich repeat domain-containing protein n=1 Tax=Zooshikella sp. RANM57 TaxID=3425863 RepID=UPI003D6F3742